MEDTKIIELYWKRDESAIRETEIKYGKLCKQLAKNILGNVEDAEEVVNETYLGLWNAIPPERPRYFKAFVCRITKNIAMTKARYINAKKRKPEVQIALSEIEGMLGVSESKVKTTLFRMRRELKKYLSGKGVEL